jgi:2-dehydropantoate 2-reductase
LLFGEKTLKLKYAIVGAGACGGLIGGRLLQSGCEAHFLARGDYDAICASGITVTGVGVPEKKTSTVSVYQSINKMPACDVILLAVKSYSNSEVLPQLRAILKSTSILIVLQNGLDIEKQIAALYPDLTQIVTVSWIKVAKQSEGSYQHLFGNTIDAINYSGNSDEYSSMPLQLEELVISDFASAGFTLDFKASFFERAWTKLALNIPLSIVCIKYNLSSDEALNRLMHKQEVQTLKEEVALVAEASGISIDLDFIDKVYDQLKAAGSRSYPSMKVDYDNNRQLEIEVIFTPVIEKAASLSLNIPSLVAAYGLLQQFNLQRNMSASSQSAP